VSYIRLAIAVVLFLGFGIGSWGAGAPGEGMHVYYGVGGEQGRFAIGRREIKVFPCLEVKTRRKVCVI
jgi:hypothetical protein